MTCEHYQRLISDDIDGALAGRERRKLQSHLDSCSACREYRIDLAHIQAESGLVKAGTVDPDYLERFAITIETKLRQEKQITGGTLLKWRWAWVFAPLALALVLGIFLFRNGGNGLKHEVFSFEGCLDRVFQEIGGEDEIAADFNRFLSDSLLEGSESAVLEGDIDIWSEPFFWRSLSDQDLKLIETEIKKGIRS